MRPRQQEFQRVNSTARWYAAANTGRCFSMRILSRDLFIAGIHILINLLPVSGNAGFVIAGRKLTP